MKRIILMGGALLMMVACNTDAGVKDLRGKELESPIVSSNQTQKELDESLAQIKKEEEEKERLKREGQAVIEFDKMSHNFGVVKAETPNTTVFTVKNVGKNPLIIENVEASCGCTTPKKPEKPILPGQSDVIEVTFKSNPGQLGGQKKVVTVTANTEERVHLLEISAQVK